MPAEADDFRQQLRDAIDKGEKTYAPVQVAFILNLATSTVQDLMRRHKIRAVKMGHVWRTTKSEIERYLSKGPYKHD